jgi:hypothetical protein
MCSSIQKPEFVIWLPLLQNRPFGYYCTGRNLDCVVRHGFRKTNKERVLMSDGQETIQLTDEDIEFIMSLLRNSSSPLSTQDLIDALRSRG